MVWISISGRIFIITYYFVLHSYIKFDHFQNFRYWNALNITVGTGNDLFCYNKDLAYFVLN